LAPMFMSSAALGAVFATLINRIVPGAHLSPGAFALVAMGAVFGAASRATFTFIVFAFEITRDFNSVLPLMLVCVIADMIAIRYLPSSIMTEKLSRRGLDVHQDYEADVLKVVKVSEVMTRDPATVPATTTVRELADRFAKGDSSLGLQRGLPVVGSESELLGIVTQGDLLRALQADPSGQMIVLDAATRPPVTAYPNERSFDALYRMLQNNIGRLPVVSRENPRKLVGYLNRSSVLSAWTRQFEDENVREHGWIRHLLARNSRGAAIVEKTLTGRVVAINQNSLEVTRQEGSETLTMKFLLAVKPVGIHTGDHVMVSFREMSEGKVVTRIEELQRHASSSHRGA
ncbi:MAG: CBS domain-containing protein, partial [Candidatus Acidiferrales bacterium]